MKRLDGTSQSYIASSCTQLLKCSKVPFMKLDTGFVPWNGYRQRLAIAYTDRPADVAQLSPYGGNDFSPIGGLRVLVLLVLNGNGAPPRTGQKYQGTTRQALVAATHEG